MKLSIITINLNNNDGLKKTIESVVSQSYSDYEYIIVDGGSIDGSIKTINQYEEKISCWISEPDKGIYNAFNKGVKMAKGEYCLFLNSGDWLVDNHILEKVFSEPLVEDIIFGDLYLISNGKVIKKNVYPEKLSMLFFYHDSLPHPATFIKRNLFEKELYDESYEIISDWYFFIKMIIYRDCSYRKINLAISYFDVNGKSSQSSLHLEERNHILNLLFPPRILQDYNTFLQFKNLKIKFLVDNYQYSKGIKKIIATFIIKLIILFYILFHKNKFE